MGYGKYRLYEHVSQRKYLIYDLSRPATTECSKNIFAKNARVCLGLGGRSPLEDGFECDINPNIILYRVNEVVQQKIIDQRPNNSAS